MKYTNCIGEKFIFKKNELLKFYYFIIDEDMEPQLTEFNNPFSPDEISESSLPAEKGHYTDIAKTPAGALIVLNKYYEKFGYPK